MLAGIAMEILPLADQRVIRGYNYIVLKILCNWRSLSPVEYAPSHRSGVGVPFYLLEYTYMGWEVSHILSSLLHPPQTMT
jgi:hypothetical protein